MQSEDESSSKLTDLKNQKGFLESISTTIEKSPAQLLLMALKYSLRHKLSFTAMTGLFQFVNQICEKTIVPETRYMIDNLCNTSETVIFHSVCPECENYLGTFNNNVKSITCSNCKVDVDVSSLSKPSFFAFIDPSDAIRDCLQKHEDYYNFVMRERCHERNHIKDIYDGKAYRKFVDKLSLQDRYSYVSTILNTDGAPVFKSSNYSIWPLYIMPNEIPSEARFDNVIVLGMWYGEKKPAMSVILDRAVEFFNEISKIGIPCKLKDKEYCVKLFVIVACVDTIARPPMNCTSQFNANYGCDWCEHPGQYFARSVRYPCLSNPPKERDKATTVEYAKEALKKSKPVVGVKSASPLLNLNFFDIITGFCPDYMHCLLAGVAKQFTQYFLKDIKKNGIDKLNDMLLKLKVPHQLGRLSRGIKDRSNWKCREWENWVLYYSLPLLSSFALDGSLDRKRLEHWSLFVDGLHICLQSNITYDQLNDVSAKFHQFVLEVENLYDLKAITYNVHQMLHIPKSIADWGPLWAHSAFAFESANYKLLRAIHAANGIILQIIRFVNMQRFVQELEKIVYPTCSPIVIEYCENLVIGKSKNMLKITAPTYLGKEIIVDTHYVQNCNMPRSTKIFTKMVYKGCLFTSARKVNARSRNDFIQLTDGRFATVIDFLVDDITMEICMCNLIETRPNKLSNAVQDVIRISNDLTPISTLQIDKVCIYIENNNHAFVIPVVNLLWY